MSHLKQIPLKEIRENKAALRVVHRESEEFVELVASVREMGILTPISVREMTDPETGHPYYSLVDGLQRFNAAIDAGLAEIPAHVLELNDVQALFAQTIGNLHRIDTKPVEYAKQLQRIMSADPLLSKAEIAARCGKSPAWVDSRLGLNRLIPQAGQLVDKNTISLPNAFAMSKLPPEEQPAFLDRAMTMNSGEFAAQVAERKKQIAKDKREGRTPGEEVFNPQPFLRKLAEIKDEFAKPTAAETLTVNCKTAVEGFSLGVAWVLNMDAESQDAQRRKDDERRKRDAARREEASIDRKRRRQERARLETQRIEVELAAIEEGEDPKEALAAFDREHGLAKDTSPAAAAS